MGSEVEQYGICRHVVQRAGHPMRKLLLFASSSLIIGCSSSSVGDGNTVASNSDEPGQAEAEYIVNGCARYAKEKADNGQGTEEANFNICIDYAMQIIEDVRQGKL